MDTTIGLSIVFCIVFLVGYGLRALISQIRRQAVRRHRQRSFLIKPHDNPRRLREEEQASVSRVRTSDLPVLGPHCRLAAAE
jgi:hypothetical protein